MPLTGYCPWKQCTPGAWMRIQYSWTNKVTGSEQRDDISDNAALAGACDRPLLGLLDVREDAGRAFRNQASTQTTKGTTFPGYYVVNSAA
ncbi:hypothetical protein INT45_005467 [Circinella minor]|uniref:Uncharacterized protein n=1 Tax=Circinella minor TaxID=1195481 RepID=A0A8H7RY80_9FUNG|nr:hypothetical protein INT45_005467 [Circinella minor]